mmetsp:Transcript_34709/g.61049  ORF Transcript_34709/g.61049 Transcript_34709/m.61049 type:complete len:427 (+) Transcript_34709:195-1475(+)
METPESVIKYISDQFEKPTPIQSYAIPYVLAERDVIGIAPTGSGKTLAYMLPIVAKLKASRKEKPRLKTVIVAPTKELSRQLFREILVLTEGTGLKIHLLSKDSYEAKVWRKTYDVLIATPLNLVHKLDTKTLKSIKYLVLDEADQLFELGFADQIDSILRQCTHKSQVKLMFSATMLPSVEILVKTIMVDPVHLAIGSKNAAVSSISQELKFCSTEQGKMIALQQMIAEGSLSPPVLVFVQSKHRAKELFTEIVSQNVRVGMVHSDMTVTERDKAIKNFRLGYVWVLICTDLMARGIDFKGVNLVINYDFPQSMVAYIHRVGRTGRAGEGGRAVTFYTYEDAPYLKIVAHVMSMSGIQVPEWITKLHGKGRKDRKQLIKKPVRREKISSKPKLTRSLRKHLKKKKDAAKGPALQEAQGQQEPQEA